jgi:hypothetical protein
MLKTEPIKERIVSRRRVVGMVCDVCGRSKRGRIPWRRGCYELRIYPSKGTRRQRLQGSRSFDLCGLPCLVRKLGRCGPETHASIRYYGTAAAAVRGILAPPVKRKVRR